MNNLDDEIKNIRRKLQEKKCALIIGPEVFTGCDDAKNYLDEIVGHLKDKGLHFERTEEGFLHFGTEAAERNAKMSIVDFYRSTIPNPIYKLIAEIPFDMIISLSPDNLLEMACNELHLPYTTGYYFKQTVQKDISLPNPVESIHSHLIYHLLGCEDNHKSLVLTFNDLYDYLESIFSEKYTTPRYFEEKVRGFEKCVIIGMQYEKWYNKLFLKILHQRSKSVYDAYYENIAVNKDVISFYENNISITFVNHNPYQFIERLHSACGEQMLLKGSKENTLLFEIEKSLNRGKEDILEGILALKKHFPDFDETNIETDYRQLENSVLRNVIVGDPTPHFNKIRERIKNFLSSKE